MISDKDYEDFFIFSDKNPEKNWHPGQQWIIQYITGKRKDITYHIKLELDTKRPGYLYNEHTTDNFLEALKFNNPEEPFTLAKFLTDDTRHSEKIKFKIVEIF
jgi:alpha-amylase/alpha-mannosidase (GH57 family)